jgi:hypothetical protein
MTNEQQDRLAVELRDYFASAAMQGILSDPDLAISKEKIAELAYTMADAMMKAREPK